MKNLIKKALQFRDLRNWGQFHTVKDLGSALNIEVGELQEIFLWKNESEISNLIKSDKKHQEISSEMADILLYLIYIADVCNVDLEQAALRKIDLNENRYPAEKSFNNAKKYTELMNSSS